MTSFKTIGILLIVCLITAYQPKKEILSVKVKLPNNWTQLSRNETGYVVYKPCDGSTPTVVINGSGLTINLQLESEKHTITSIYQVSDTTFEVSCDNSILNITIKWLDRDRTKALWKFKNLGDNNTLKWIMCPTKIKFQFPIVDNSCPTEKIKEKVFLPIDID
jgi:hypothetical protein